MKTLTFVAEMLELLQYEDTNLFLRCWDSCSMKTLTFVSEMMGLLQYEDTNLCF